MALIAPTLTALINSVATDCSSINFSDTTTNYGGTSGGNQIINYNQVTSVTWELYDGSFTTKLGTFANSGWLPYPSNDVTLFANEFGLGNFYPNNTYGINYIITWIDSNGATQTTSCHSNTFVVQCGAGACPTTQYQFDYPTSGLAYPNTVTGLKIDNVAYTPSLAVTSQSDLITKLNAYIAGLVGAPQNVKYAKFIANGSNVRLNTPYYLSGTLAGFTITFTTGGVKTANATGTVTINVVQQTVTSYDCVSKQVIVSDTSGIWTGNTFPQFADINAPITAYLYQVGNGTPLATATLSLPQYQNYITNTTTADALFPSVILAPCIKYYIVFNVDLLNGSTLGCYNSYFQLSYCGSLKDTPTLIQVSGEPSRSCDAIIVCDTTGDYNSVSNKGGYGIPNITYEDIVSTTFEITRPDGTVVIIDKLFVPTEYGNNCVSFSVTDIFGSTTTLTTIPDAVYPITYKVWGDCQKLLGTATINVFYACGLKKCLDQRAVDTCCGEPDEIAQLNLDYANYIRLQAAAAGGGVTCANNGLQQAYQQCMVKCVSCNQ
jgi:hypothetical protein